MSLSRSFSDCSKSSEGQKLAHLQKTANASEPDSVELSIKPFEGSEIYVANEAYRSMLLPE